MTLTRDAGYYRRMAEVVQHQLDTMSPGERAIASHVARLTKERDQWTQLAEEVEEYLESYDEGSWTGAGPDDVELF